MTDYTNDSAETLGFAEVFSNGAGQAFAEALDLHTFYPATPFHIGSDLGIYTGAMSPASVAEFIRTRAPLGYSPFRDFVAGEYKFQKAYINFAFEPLDGADAQIAMTAAKITADVPDKAETNVSTVTVASTGITIAFSTAFAVAPKVTVTPITSGSPIIPVLTIAPTTAGFTVKLFDLAGAAVTGTFIWTAIGY